MDLSVSPDLDAYFCYAIVALLGALAAGVQISKRLGGIRGIWFVPRTWLLFGMYIAVPIALFWLLDRTGAIIDTSFFAAVLVGVGYERIIAGGDQAIRAPGEVSLFWTPFLAYADRVARMVRERTATRQQRLVEQVVAEIAEHPDRLPDLQRLAMRFAPDPAALQAQLAAIDANAPALGANGILEQKTQLLYGVLVAVPDAHYLMKNKKIISGRFYWQNVKRASSLALSILSAAALALAAIVIVINIKPRLGDGLAKYYIWRLAKTNSSSTDQVRSRQHLVELMRHHPEVNQSVMQALANVLRRPNLPVERIDLVLQTMLESRSQTNDRAETATLLLQSLRAGSVDVRLRINEVLKFLAQGCAAKFDEGSSVWKPSEGDSTTALEERIFKWTTYWSAPCVIQRQPEAK